MFKQEDREHLEGLGGDVNTLFSITNSLEGRIGGLEAGVRINSRRLSNLLVNQNELRSAMNQLAQIIDTNASRGNVLMDEFEDKMRTVKAMFQRTQEAIEVVAAEMGKKIDIAPEVPATVTFTPGEPARVVLVKAPRVKRVKPQPVTVEVPKNLLPGGYVDIQAL